MAARGSALSGYPRAALRRARERLATGVRLLQQALATTTAWVIADLAIDHYHPFFAPITAVIALNAFLGQRGANALRLLQQVIVGSEAVS
ncbi:hypothetical protein GCM10011608_54380 [Micromonospora sonchi]|uniref:Uncharacterized protein n=1 Tax=Micromonospora sonchi TaxID=1763543 RepID=A0A917U734_9ACTN|nr:hypothetical protein GCM10011608_54380 [Micromonospora sonchi]